MVMAALPFPIARFDMKLIRRTYRHLALALAMVIVGYIDPRPLPAATPRIGLLTYWTCDRPNDEFGSFLHGLEELGYKPGVTIDLECQGSGRNYNKLVEAATALVQASVDVIVATSQPAGRAAHEATDKIPIVTIVSGDPVAAGFARSIAKPGGNLTGLSYYATELTAKRLELLKEAVRGISKIGVLANPVVSYLPFEADTRRAADKLGLFVTVHQVSQPPDIEVAFEGMKREGMQAVFVLPDLMLADEAGHIATLGINYRLPTMAWGPWFVQAGCLMAYSANYDEMGHRLAFYVDRILKGANPGDLPIEQPTRFRLSINSKTAATLGLELPQDLMLLADDVIE
jgi:putative ABC transport system substrate-binding protein